MRHIGLDKEKLVTIRVTNAIFNRDFNLIGKCVADEIHLITGERHSLKEKRDVARKTMGILFGDSWTRRDVVRACEYICRPETRGAYDVAKSIVGGS